VRRLLEKVSKKAKPTTATPLVVVAANGAPAARRKTPPAPAGMQRAQPKAVTKISSPAPKVSSAPAAKERSLVDRLMGFS